MINCPFCHFENEDGALFCEQCKSDLAGVMPASALAVPVAEAVPVEATPVHAEAVPVFAEATPVDAEPAPFSAEAVPMFAEEVPLVAEATPVEAEPVAAEPFAALASAEPVAEEPFAGLASAVPVAEAVPVAAPEVVPATPIAVAAPMAPAPEAPAAAPAPMPAAAPAPAPVAVPAAPAGSALGPGAAARLIVLRGLKRSVEYPIFEGLNFIGRADDKPVDIDLEDQEPEDRVWCSRQHACITFENNQIEIEDLNSSNGTYLNRQRIYPGQKKTMAPNDVVQIGNVQMKLLV